MADHRHKRDANARRYLFALPRATRVAGPIALLATLSTVGVGVLAANPETRELLTATTSASVDSSAPVDSDPVDLSDRPEIVSRSGSRIERLSDLEQMLTPDATNKAIRKADTKLWTTAALNLWSAPSGKAAKVGVVKETKRVLITGRKASDRVEVVVNGKSRWVTAGYLSEEKPGETTDDAEDAEGESEPAGLGGACTNGSSVSGQPNVIGVHQAVCAAFPELTSYGTYRSDGEHSQGIAIDISVSGARGWQVAEFVRANYAALEVNYIMYSQKIWSVDRGSEGWRSVADRGSVTANHYDHVHVTTY